MSRPSFASLLPHLPSIAEVVRDGLTAPRKHLPAHLLYDAEGSRLYEAITELPEYYPTRTERAILARHADEIVARALEGTSAPLRVIELGAGTASKTRLLLEAVVRRQGRCLYVPIDVSATALAEARARIESELPSVTVQPFHGDHREALVRLRDLGSRRLVMFIGSSIGNFEDADAVELLAGVRRGLHTGGALLLGTDLQKSPELLIPAYDDADGVTAAFNRNVLARINRELGGHFDLDTFRHVALWNAPESRIEMHLESTLDLRVPIDALDLEVRFHAGERIHTESSIKYDYPRVDRLLGAAGFGREHTFCDDAGFFAVHLARARG